MQPESRESSPSVPTRRNWVSFWSLLALQTQNGFNDKAAQFLLIPLAGALALQAKESGQDVGFLGSRMAHVLGALIVLPFILFAPVAGWLSDRFSKTHVIRGTLVMQLLVLGLIVVAVAMGSLPLAVVGFFLLSVESVLLSPAKKGIVKELVGHSRLGFASGLLEMSVVLAVCFGQIVSGWWYDLRREAGYGIWEAAYFPMLVIAVAATVSLLLSFRVERVRPMGWRRFDKGVWVEHFSQLRELLANKRLRRSGIGVSFFWGFAGFINLVAIQIGADLSGGGGIGFGSENSWLMLAASGGITLGGVVASLVCRKGIALGLVPIGGLVMLVGSLALGFGPIERGWLMVWLAITGSGGAMLLVPLNAYLQDICPPDKRGRVLAGLNLLDCLAGLVAVVVQFAMAHFGVPYAVQFGVLAVVCVVATCYSSRLLPQHFLRLAGLAVFRFFYRVRAVNPVNIPKEGGVLLTPNHMSYIDAFILSCACPRPIRFLMFSGYFKHPLIGRFARLFHTVPISTTRAKEAVRVTAEALEEGAVVCIFPEGQLSRTGVMNEFKRGFEMIASRAGCPVVPTVMDGLWGSVFSFERNRFNFKWPYRVRFRVTVSFGDALSPEAATAGVVRRMMNSLRADAMAMRKVLVNPARMLGKEVEVTGGDVSGYAERVDEIRRMDGESQRQLLANAVQVGEVNAIRRGQTVLVDWQGLGAVRDVLAVAFARYYGLKVVLADVGADVDAVRELVQSHGVEVCLAGDVLGPVWHRCGVPGECYDFSADAMSHEGVFPCCVRAGRVVSVSMPDPDAITATNQRQEGHRKGTWGRLLPGFHVDADERGVSLAGVSVPDGGIRLDGMRLDADAMLG